MAVSVNKNLAASYILEDPLGRIANDGRVSNLGRVGKKGYIDSRFAVNFDGVDDYGVLANRAINPDGDIDIEWEQRDYDSASLSIQTIVAQCNSATASLREFTIRSNTNEVLLMIIGGSLFGTDAGVYGDGKWRSLLVGNNWTVFKDGVVVSSATITRGAAREPIARTLVAAREASAVQGDYMKGFLYNVRINGVLWPMADRNQTIQLPEPSGLGAELISSPSSSEFGSWTYSGGTLSASAATAFSVSMAFPVSVIAGQQYLLEYEITSMTGSVRPRLSGGSNVNGTTEATIGIKRLLVTAATGNNALLFQAIAEGTSLSIKNISFKPLTVVNATELVTNGDFSAGATGWTATSTSSFTVASGQASVGYVAGQNSRIQQTETLEAGKYYEFSATVVSISGLSSAFVQIIRDSAGSFATIAESSVTTAGQIRFAFLAPANDAIIRLRTGDTANSGTIVWDNISLRKLDSLCNPMTLVNVTSDRWQEVAQ